jgi:hypothetical protein
VGKEKNLGSRTKMKRPSSVCYAPVVIYGVDLVSPLTKNKRGKKKKKNRSSKKNNTFPYIVKKKKTLFANVAVISHGSRLRSALLSLLNRSLGGVQTVHLVLY